MLLTVCGEDTGASRNYISQLKQEYKKKDYEILNIAAKDIEEQYKNDMSAGTLFSLKKVLFLDNLSQYAARKRDKIFLEMMAAIQSDKELDVINWEGNKTARDLNAKVYGTIKEFKPSESIFSLLEACYPGNFPQFIAALHSVSTYQEEGFIFAMLCKHIRSLILASANALPATVMAWQKSKLTAQANRWNEKKLIAFYEGLARIDAGLKTSSNVYGLTASIELLICYFM